MLPSLWTEERKAYVDKAWPTGIPVAEMLVALNQMPGPPIPKTKQVADEARRRQAKRPDWYKLQLRRENCTGPKKPKPKKVEKPKRVLWTPERLELLTRLWPAATPNSDILAKLNDLAGDKFTSGKQLSAKAELLRIRRPDGFYKRSDLWSDERDSILRTRYEAGSSSEEIIEELNSYPGTPLATRQQLADRASILGVRRPKDYLTRVAAARQQAKVVDRKPPRMPLPRKLPEPKRAKGSPIKVPYHVLYNQGFQLWYGEAYGREAGDLLPRDKRDDLEAINRAIRKAEPGHPGFEIATKYWGRQ